jgi:predicted Fe-Mo cluster-binding NifX family protein
MNQRLAIAIEECPGNIDKVAEHFGRCSKFVVCEINPAKEVVLKETYFNPLSGKHNYCRRNGTQSHCKFSSIRN